MKSTQYSKKVMDHFQNPRNAGVIEKDENVASGKVGNPTCGDIMEIFIKVDDSSQVIEDIKFRTFGCGSAIATSSMLTVLAKGKTLDEAEKITRIDVADALDGLPPIKMHCSNLAADALKEAINTYRGKSNTPLEKDSTAHPAWDSYSIEGELKYLDKGVNYYVNDYSDYKDQRTLLVHRGDNSIHQAIELTKYTNRVILTTTAKSIPVIDNALAEKLKDSSVKVLAESKVLQIDGEGEVEKVKMLNMDEDEEYELFVDKIILLESLSIPISCEDSD